MPLDPKIKIKTFFSEYSNFESDVKYILVIETVGSIGGGIFSFLFIFYILNLGFGTVFYGLISSITGFSYIMALPMGIISSRLGSRKMVILGILTSIIAMLIYVVTSNPFLFYIGAIFYGISGSFTNPNFNSLLSKATSEKRRNFAFSMNGFLNLLGTTAGIVASGFFPGRGKIIFGNELLGFKLALIIIIILMVITLLIMRRIGIDIKMNKNERIKVPKPVLKTMTKLTVPASLIGLGAGFVIPYFQLQFQYRFHLSITAISYIFSITSFAMALLMLFIPFIARKKGSLTTIVTFQLIAAILLLSMPFTSSLKSMGVYLFSALYFFRTILMNVTGPVQSSFELSMVDERYRPIMSSLVSLSWVGMNSVSVYLGGLIMQYSLNIPFYICAIFYITSSVLYYTFFKNLLKRE